MEFRAALLLIISLVTVGLTSTAVKAVDPVKKSVPPPVVLLPLPNDQWMTEPSMLLPPPSGEAVAVTRSRSSRQAANPDADLTTELRRWQGVASAAGMQPYTWGLSGDVTAQLALGLQSTLFFTDNVDFALNSRKQDQTIFEFSPIIKLDLGDPQGWISSPTSRQSEYYASLLWVPTFYYRLNDDTDDYAEHFLGEIGRVNAVSRSLLRVNHDERILASSENTSPEQNYTLLDIMALVEYRLSPRFTLRTSADYRKLDVAQAVSSRAEWIGEAALLWEHSPKTKLGLGTELGHLIFDQRALGTQDYQQALALLEWKPTPKIGLTSRTGLEWREFNRSPPREMKTSLVTLTTLYWQATEKTRINTRFRVANRPSVIAQGSLYRETRFGADILHDLSLHYYTTAEVQAVRRRYDSGRLDWEPTARLAFGFRDDNDRANNRLNIELFLQWHRRERSDIPNADLERTQVGIQVTRYF